MIVQRPIATSANADYEDDHEEDLKDLYDVDFDRIEGESQFAFQLRFLFYRHGYQKVKIEEPDTHAVVVVRGPLQIQQCIRNEKVFFRHIRQLLAEGGFVFKKDELTTGLNGRRFLVAFPIDRFAPERAEEIHRTTEMILNHMGDNF